MSITPNASYYKMNRVHERTEKKTALTTVTLDITNMAGNFFSIRVVRHWNSISEEKASAETINSLKNRIDLMISIVTLLRPELIQCINKYIYKDLTELSPFLKVTYVCHGLINSLKVVAS